MTGALLSGRPDMGGQSFISLSILIPPFSIQATLSGNEPELFLACRVTSEEHFYSPFCLPMVESIHAVRVRRIGMDLG